MNTNYKIFLFTIFLLVVFMFVNHNELFDIPVRLNARPFLYQLVFYANYIGLMLSCFIFLTVKSQLIRYVFYFSLFLTISITIATDKVHGNSFGIFEANIMFTEIQFASQVASAFFYEYLGAIGIALFITTLVSYIAFRFFPRISNLYALIPIIFISYSVKINYTSKSWHTLFPCVFNVPIIAADAYLSIPRFGPRNEPFLKPTNKSLFKHIFWIVDESIRGDMLGANNSPLPTTPFLDKIKNDYYNYGITSSSTHYSYGSNIILQSGLRADQLPDNLLKFGTNPNIFQYSKLAGFTTYFIDGQNKNEIPQNGMTNYDFKHIDKYVQIQKMYPDIKWYSVDSTIVKYIAEILKTQGNTFTYINKAGCHFAYNNFYPQEQEVFTPAYRSGKSWTNQKTLINTYCNCIKWGVDDFFKKLYPYSLNEDAIFIYTSDHGVTLLEKGRPVQDTDPHNPLPLRATVPLLIFAGNHHPELFQFAEQNKNKLSHFSIFPGTLFLLGYDQDKVTALYGKSLFMQWEKTKRIFFSGTIYDSGNCYINDFE